MIVWLNLDQNSRWSPNENYARELMELFTLGADRGAYTEQDVRQLARALTGFDFDWSDELGMHNFRYVPTRHDNGDKTVFGQTGTWTWEQGVAMCVRHPLHPSFFVHKLWSYFIPTPPSAADRQALESSTCRAATRSGPCSRRSCCHPDLHAGPRMVKPPVVFLAGLLRALQRSRRRRVLDLVLANAGQRLFYPPDVSGWDDSRWLDTARCAAASSWSRGRSPTASRRRRGGRLRRDRDPRAGACRGARLGGRPGPDAETVALLTSFAASALAGRRLAAQHLPRPAPERAAPPDPRLPRLPDELTMRELRLQRLLAHPAASARGRRGGARTARDRARHADAGGHGPHAALVRLARHRARAVGVRRGEPRAQGVRGGDRGRRGAGALRAGAGVDLPLRRRRLAHDARAHERASAVRREPAQPGAARRGRARRFAEDPSLRWHPSLAGSPSCTARARSGDAGDRLRRRQPVALHEPPLLGGRRAEPVRPLGLARPLPRPSRHAGQPAPGAGARLGPPAGAGRTRRSRGHRRGAGQLRLLDAWRVGHRAGQDAGRVRRPRRSPTSDIGLGQARAAVAPPGACATSWRRSRAASPRRRGHLPAETSRAGCARSRRCSTAACR